LHFVPTLPKGTTKLDLQNNPELGELVFNLDGAELDEVTWLYIQSVPVRELYPDTFRGMRSLTTLEISLTELTLVPRDAINPDGDALKTLTFADNGKLARFEKGVFSDLHSVENLKFLNMSSFAFGANEFENMASLKVFTANNCGGLTRLPADLFTGSIALESITLEMNFELAIIDYCAFCGAGSVRTLRLIELRALNTLVDEETSVFFGLSGLQHLTIASEIGGVVAIHEASFAGLVNLESVDLNLADLTKMAAGAFAAATNLLKVTIRGASKMVTLPAGLFDGVRESVEAIVFASLGVHMPTLAPALFNGMDSVTTLEISCCGIEKLVNTQFNLPNIVALIVSNNEKLSEIEPGTFANCKKLQTLTVSNNPILTRLVAGTFDHAFDADASSVLVNLEGNGLKFISSRAINFDADGAPAQTVVVVNSAAGTNLDVCCAYEWMTLDRHYFTNGLLCNTSLPPNEMLKIFAHNQEYLSNEFDISGSGMSGMNEMQESPDVGGTDSHTGTIVEIGDPNTGFGCCFADGWALGVEHLHSQTVGNSNGDDLVASYENLDFSTQRYLREFCLNARWSGATKLSDTPDLECAAPADQGCKPELQAWFSLKFSQSSESCISTDCPTGQRLESIGRSYLLDCEPWLHGDRSYVTRHAVAEQHCVECVIEDCKVCNSNYRQCDECDAEHSLYVDLDTNVHKCVPREECPESHYSTNEHGLGVDDGNELNLHRCVAWTKCGDGQVETSVGTALTDRECDTSFGSEAVGGTIGGIAAFFFLLITAIVFRHKHHINVLNDEINKLGKALVGVRHVTKTVDYASMGITPPPGADSYINIHGTSQLMTSATSFDLNTSDGMRSFVKKGGITFEHNPQHGKGTIKPDNPFRWYWQEQSDRIDSHSKFDLLQPGNYVAFSWSICSELDAHFSSGTKLLKLDLTNRISSTGTEDKAFGKDTGLGYEINFEQMTQKNLTSGYVRSIQRVEVKAATSVQSAIKKWPPAPESLSPLAAGAVKIAGGIPADLMATDDFKLLVVQPGQLVQQHQIRKDGWAFGAILYDPTAGTEITTGGTPPGLMPANVDISYDNETGWFPLKCTELATATHLAKLQEKMGAGAADALAPPPHWDQVRDALVAERIKLSNGPEKADCVNAFRQTLPTSATVVSVERIQNMAMWQSYAVKRQGMIAREKLSSIGSQEKKWLFHGTSADTVPKIIQQGFNRGFAGKNAVVYGKGVYFAKNSSYSASTTYSPPDSSNVQQMFLCRVLTGHTCVGTNGQLVPDVRDASRHILYDCTTNSDKSIFVTYHDSQQYPEYLIRFK
jgi:Leucine-rich repeat (LRR) protein